MQTDLNNENIVEAKEVETPQPRKSRGRKSKTKTLEEIAKEHFITLLDDKEKELTTLKNKHKKEKVYLTTDKDKLLKDFNSVKAKQATVKVELKGKIEELINSRDELKSKIEVLEDSKSELND